MVNKTNGEYSRAPEFKDLISLCRSLNEAGVRYVLIGGFAVVLHGYTRATKDIDLLVDPSKENIQRVNYPARRAGLQKPKTTSTAHLWLLDGAVYIS